MDSITDPLSNGYTHTRTILNAVVVVAQSLIFKGLIQGPQQLAALVATTVGVVITQINDASNVEDEKIRATLAAPEQSVVKQIHGRAMKAMKAFPQQVTQIAGGMVGL